MGILGVIFDAFRKMKMAKKYKKMGKEALLSLEEEDFYDAVACISEDASYDLQDPRVREEHKILYTLTKFEMEVNNGGLCQFFVNSSRECAPYVGKALAAIGADGLKALYEGFIAENKIDVRDLSSFDIASVEEYEAQTERYDFDAFDDRFYEDELLHQQILDYAKAHIDGLIQ